MTQPATPELSSTGSRLLGETVAGNLVIRRFLGADALGECYVCLDEGMAESVRLTLVSEARLESGGAPLRAAFLEAMKTTAGVDHSNVLAVRKIIDDGRDVGAVTKLVEGTTLADYVAEYGALPVEVALDLFLPIADALLTLHEQGIGHGVLRPSSIFVEQRAGRLEPLLMNAGSGPVVKLVPELDLERSRGLSRSRTRGVTGFIFRLEVSQHRLQVQHVVAQIGLLIFREARLVHLFIGAEPEPDRADDGPKIFCIQVHCLLRSSDR